MYCLNMTDWVHHGRELYMSCDGFWITGESIMRDGSNLMKFSTENEALSYDKFERFFGKSYRALTVDSVIGKK